MLASDLNITEATGYANVMHRICIRKLLQSLALQKNNFETGTDSPVIRNVSYKDR